MSIAETAPTPAGGSNPDSSTASGGRAAPPRRGRRSLLPTSRKHREWLAAAAFLAPDCLGLLIFVGIPMALSLILAFYRVSGFGDYEFIGFDNFRRMAEDPLFWNSMQITVVYVTVLVPLVFGCSLGLGLLIKHKLPGVGIYRTAFFMPHVISVVVVGLIWQFMLNDQTGVVNRGLGFVGVEGQSWLGDPSLALGTVIAVSAWLLMGYYMVIFLAGLQDIPGEYYDSARIDGAGAWSSFRHVTWPLLRPTSFFVLMTSTVAAITGGFDLIFILTGGGPANGTSVAVFYIYQQAFVFGEYGYSAAMGSFLVLIMLICSAIIFAVTKGGRFHDAD